MSAERDRLVREALPVLGNVARSVARRLGGQIPLDDLISIGHGALLEVAESFDPARGPLSAYASRKIRWAIFDGLRRETHGRAVAARASAMAASERFADGFDHELPAGDAASEAGYQAHFRNLMGGHAAALAVGLAAGRARRPAIVDPPTSPEDRVVRGDLMEAIREALARLPERSRHVIERHYFGDASFDAIAAELGISKSWVSRLHAQALSALAAALDDGRG